MHRVTCLEQPSECAVGFYRNRVLPWIIDASMRNRELRPYRERVISSAEGTILEIGVGAGANLPFYGPKATTIVAIEPAAPLIEMTRELATRRQLPVELIAASAENIPLPDRQFDTVVTTFTLCSIPDVMRAMKEIRRVMKPNGRLLFAEHGLSPDASVRKWQDRLTPAWRCLGGGCHLNRPIRELIQGAGFRIEHLHTGYMKGPRPMTYI